MIRPKPAFSRAAPLFLVYCLLLFASFSYDAFWLNGSFRDGHIGYDSYLVLNRLKLASEGIGFWHPMGTYRTQFGLQGVVFSAVMLATGLDPIPFAYLAAQASSLLTAAVLAAFFVSIASDMGRMTAHVGVFLTALSPILLEFAPSLYWCSFLLFAPFVCVWILYPRTRALKGRLTLAAVALLLVALKCLCGYEYVTTVGLSPVAAVAFHLVRSGEFRARHWLELIVWSASGCGGFILALGVHVLQLVCLFGPSEPNLILQRAKFRVYAGDARAEAPMNFERNLLRRLPDNIEYPLNCFLHYFQLRAITWPGGASGVPLYAVTALALLFAAWATVQRRRLSPEVLALSWSLALSLLTSLSWQMAAVNHMSVHFHLNQVVYWIPFLLLASVSVGFLVQQALTRLHLRAYVLPLLAPACLLLIAANLLRHSHQQVNQQLLAARVQRCVLDSTDLIEPWPGTGMQGAFDGIRPGKPWTAEMARSALSSSLAEDVLIISGWFVDPRAPDLAKKAFLVRRGGGVETAECQFFTRGDVNAYLGMPAPEAGFHITVPKPQPGDRVLLLCGRDFSRVVEVQRF
jgi:hypothetical protein